jgi:hypothetical protein
MFANYFVGGVPFDALGSGIPTRDLPLWVKKIDSVIDDRLNQSFVNGAVVLS